MKKTDMMPTIWKWTGESGEERKNDEIVLALIKIQCENKNFLIVSVLWLQIIGECHSNNTRADRCDESFEKRFVFNGVHKSSLNNNEQKVVSNDIEISPKKVRKVGFDVSSREKLSQYLRCGFHDWRHSVNKEGEREDNDGMRRKIALIRILSLELLISFDG